MVADEVRKLAERTATATNDIAALVASIQGETQETRGQMERWAQRTSAFDREGTAARVGMDALVELARRMEGSISAAALRSFVEVAKIDHLVYKFEAYRVLMGMSEKTVVDFADHSHCRLGKWYYEVEGRARFSAVPGFAEVEAPHRRFHDAGAGALREFAQGRTEACFVAVDAMEAESRQVLAALDRIAGSTEG